IGPGDCVLYWSHAGAHTIGGVEGLDVLAFGPRVWDESVGFPRQGFSLLGKRGVETVDGVKDGFPVQFVREVEVGPPEVPDELDERPDWIKNLGEVEQDRMERGKISRVRRNLGKAVGSEATGIQHVSVAPGMESVPLHCHSMEEEIFVMLEGDGVLVLN